MTQGKLNQHKECLLDQTENIRVVILENLLYPQKLKCLRKSTNLHLQKSLSWKHSEVFIKVALEDSENSKSKLSSKMSFWGSPDSSPGIEKLFNAMNLCDNLSH
jgi:hypothetical protein